jgi:hypothetical protein
MPELDGQRRPEGSRWRRSRDARRRAGQQTLWPPIRDAHRLAAYRAATGVPLPAWWDRCVATAPARICPCGSYRVRWDEDAAT